MPELPKEAGSIISKLPNYLLILTAIILLFIIVIIAIGKNSDYCFKFSADFNSDGNKDIEIVLNHNGQEAGKSSEVANPSD